MSPESSQEELSPPERTISINEPTRARVHVFSVFVFIHRWRGDFYGDRWGLVTVHSSRESGVRVQPSNFKPTDAAKHRKWQKKKYFAFFRELLIILHLHLWSKVQLSVSICWFSSIMLVLKTISFSPVAFIQRNTKPGGCSRCRHFIPSSSVLWVPETIRLTRSSLKSLTVLKYVPWNSHSFRCIAFHLHPHAYSWLHTGTWVNGSESLGCERPFGLTAHRKASPAQFTSSLYEFFSENEPTWVGPFTQVERLFPTIDTAKTNQSINWCV